MATRNYRKEYDSYHASPTQKKRRAGRNAALAQVKKRNGGKKPKNSFHSTIDNPESVRRVMPPIITLSLIHI